MKKFEREFNFYENQKNREKSKDTFFKKTEEQRIALTFDDVRLKSGYSKVMPDDVDLESKFSRNIGLKIPIVSAAMDTVTEHQMGIGMALLGGLGVIHKNMSPEEQARRVSKVKYYLNGLIDKPICVRKEQSIAEILKMKKEKEYSFNTFPVIDKKDRLVGILSKNDFDFCKSGSIKAGEAMSKEVITAPKGTKLEKAYEVMFENKKKTLPLVDKDNRLAGIYVFKDVKRIMMENPGGYNVDENGQLVAAAAIGVNDFERLELLIEKKINVVVIDTAHADTESVVQNLKEIKKKYKIDVVVGNVSEPESTKRLIKAGADGIKVGQGPGSICTTRVVAGIGSPQVSAVYKCSKIAQEYGVPVCADGGLKYSGDIPIALGAGAHCVMMGGMLSGTKEAPGDVIFREGRQWKIYRGMGSVGAMEEHKGSRERYRQSSGKKSLVAEGVEGLKPYKGGLSQVMFQYINGLRRGMGYVGAADIAELHRKADFVRISGAGKAESHPHDILITREPPNYPIGD